MVTKRKPAAPRKRQAAASKRRAPRALPARSAGQQRALKEDVAQLLRGRGAHVEFERAVADMPSELQGRQPPGTPYSAWQQLEHLRRAQRDILDYVRDPDYEEKRWPEDYWPGAEPPSTSAWAEAVHAFEADRAAFARLVMDPRADLLARVPHDPKGPTILHEALLLADHNAYHLGQLIVLRRALGAWKD